MRRATIEAVDSIAIDLTAATKFGKIDRQWAGPFVLAIDRELCGMKSVARQEQVPLEIARPSRLDKLEIELFIRAIDFVADNRVAS